MNRESGFTLIELIIVFAIIAILSGIGFVGGRSGDRSLALDRSSHQVAQDIRKAGELALRAEVSTICGGPPSQLSGYGIYFTETNRNEYILYANCSGNQEGYSDSGSKPDKEVQKVLLEGPVQIQSMEGKPAAGPWVSQSKWSVAFFPPDPRVGLCISNACSGPGKLSEAKVILALKSDPTKTKTITINEKGAISID